MMENCAPVCFACHYFTSIEYRCPIDPAAPNAWGAGDLDKMFTKLTQEPYLSEYSVEILSSPMTHEGGPWVITMEDVVTKEEAIRLIELGERVGYSRSTEVGSVKPDGSYGTTIQSRRTSETAWCYEKCYEDELAKGVMDRVSNLTGIPETNSEYLQLLKYRKGQFYDVHHDYIDYNIRRQRGVRVLTVFLYLNDVKAGGETKFDQLNISVVPKRGRALLWPNVLNERPNEQDNRTTHQAFPVEQGVKYGANAWFHMRDFKISNANGC